MGPRDEQDREGPRGDVHDPRPVRGDPRGEPLHADPEEPEEATPAGPKLAHASPMRPGAAYPATSCDSSTTFG